MGIELLESILDLQLGINSPEEWLERLALLAQCQGAYAISWVEKRPETAMIKSSRDCEYFTSQWIESVEQLITATSTQNTTLLSDLTQPAVPAGSSYHEDPHLMVAALDLTPVRTMLVLEKTRAPTSGWVEQDHAHFRSVIPLLAKAHAVHKQLSAVANTLNIANKVADATPRGIFVMTPDGHLLKTNRMAKDILGNADGFCVTPNGRLAIMDTKVDEQFNQRLAEMSETPDKQLKHTVWNRSFLKRGDSGSYQMTLRQLVIDDWHIEANAFDRRAVVYVASPETQAIPTISHLRDFYDLTNAQARLVRALMEGKDIMTAAANLHISVNTVRSHLRSIYSKLGVDSQPALLRLLSSTLVDYSMPSDD